MEKGGRRPNSDVVRRCYTFLKSGMEYAVESKSASAALDIYEDAEQLLGTTAVQNLREDKSISINGPWIDSKPNLTTAVNIKTGEKPL